jgi:nicotinic acid mononucleotide adenylyltransferase
MLTDNEPDVDFTLALGADTFIDLANGKWRRTEEVFKLVGHRMIIFRRMSENNNGPEKEEQIQQGIAKWQLLNETMSSIRLVGIPSLTDASSSTVRSTSDETILSKLVTKPILEYIKQNKLYAFSETINGTK